MRSPIRITEFHSPLLVYTGVDSTDDVHALLREWKDVHLHDNRLKTWVMLQSEYKPSPVLRLFAIVRLFWPLIALTVASIYLPTASVCFASVFLLIIQAVMLVKFCLDVWEATCVTAAFRLEEKWRNEHEETP